MSTKIYALIPFLICAVEDLFLLFLLMENENFMKNDDNFWGGLWRVLGTIFELFGAVLIWIFAVALVHDVNIYLIMFTPKALTIWYFRVIKWLSHGSYLCYIFIHYCCIHRNPLYAYKNFNQLLKSTNSFSSYLYASFKINKQIIQFNHSLV